MVSDRLGGTRGFGGGHSLLSPMADLHDAEGQVCRTEASDELEPLAPETRTALTPNSATNACAMVAVRLRVGNFADRQPTLDVFRKRVAVMEGGVAAVATASGQSATARADAGRVWRQDRSCGASLRWSVHFPNSRRIFPTDVLQIQPLLGGSSTSNADPTAIEEHTRSVFEIIAMRILLWQPDGRCGDAG
ncbi:hypothetical protein B0H19DRAFT_1374317 [Mycena capillaripes]|nr:hypothetical protein B0H19DRAFT_1374317 [Mycena capillaripes]